MGAGLLRAAGLRPRQQRPLCHRRPLRLRRPPPGGGRVRGRGGHDARPVAAHKANRSLCVYFMFGLGDYFAIFSSLVTEMDQF